MRDKEIRVYNHPTGDENFERSNSELAGHFFDEFDTSLRFAVEILLA